MSKFDPDPELVLSIVLGDVAPSDYPGITVGVLYQYDVFREEMILGLNVKVESVSQEFVLREVLSRKTLAQSNVDTEQAIWRVYHSIAKKMSSKLFEHDPRIGLPMNVKFPDCPLFDPSYITHPYCQYLVEKRSGKTPTAVAEVIRVLTTCPFCQGRIHPFGDSRRPGVWGGGNVGFVHEDCAPWVTPRY